MRPAALLISVVVLAGTGCSAAGTADRPAANRPGGPATTALAAPTGSAPVTAAGSRTRVRVAVDGATITVTVVLPDKYRPAAAAPMLLALPPGGQGQAEVDALLDRYWAAQGQRRGWVVVSPEAPPSGLFISGESARLLPDLLDVLTRWYPPEGGRVHVAGVSNGGLSAFRLALDHPDRVRSLLAAPGYPPEPADRTHVAVLAQIPVLLVVGGEDTDWRESMEQTAADLTAAGGQVRLVVSPGEGHMMAKVSARTLWDFLDQARR